MEKKVSKKKQVKELTRDIERQNELIIELTNTRNRAIEQLGYQADRICMQNELIDLLIDEMIAGGYATKKNIWQGADREKIKNHYTKVAQKRYLKKNGENINELSKDK